MRVIRPILPALAVALGLVCPAIAADQAVRQHGDDKAALRHGDDEAACFLLHEIGVGDTARGPATACDRRLTPASTFKIPHALAALDAGVLDGAKTRFAWDQRPLAVESWRHDHTLETAMRYSVVWYFQRVAERMGLEREEAYLKRFDYGNALTGGALTSFWLGGELAISPLEQMVFLRRFFGGSLPVRPEATVTVQAILVQPPGIVFNSRGEHPFDAPWPAGTTLRAKTGSATDRTGSEVRWLVGQARRGGRSWIFVTCVTGGPDLPADAAIALAARRLREEKVL